MEMRNPTAATSHRCSRVRKRMRSMGRIVRKGAPEWRLADPNDLLGGDKSETARSTSNRQDGGGTQVLAPVKVVVKTAHGVRSGPGVRVLLVLSLVAALVGIPTSSQAQVSGCTQAPDICAPDGVVSLTFTKTGDPSCVFNASIDWDDGSVDQLSNLQDGQQITHTYDAPDFYTVQITGSGSSPDPNATCTFTPGTVTVEVPTGPPPCDASGQPEGCVFVISVIDKHLSDQQRADYLKSAKDIRERLIPQTELQRDTLCEGVKGGKLGKDLVKKGLREIINGLPGKEVKKGARKLLGIPDFCTGPYNYAIERLRKIAAHLDRIANDPPDPNYKELPVPDPKPVPNMGNDALAKAAERYSKSLSKLEAHVKAALTALERAQGADQAGEDIWALRQTVAVANFARSSSDAVDSVLSRATDFSSKTKKDFAQRREALLLLTRSANKAAISQLLRSAGLSVRRFFSILKGVRSDLPRRMPALVDKRLEDTLSTGATALRAYGDLLYSP
jgi:hypothetical protein